MQLRSLASALLPLSALAAAIACDTTSTDEAATAADGGFGPETSLTDAPTTTPDGAVACKPGAFDWGTSVGGAGQGDAVTGIAVDAQGAVWVAGTFIGDARFGDAVLTAQDKVHPNGFVAKLDLTNKVLFARVIGGGAQEENTPARLRVDKDGNVYVAGTFFRHFTYDGQSVEQNNALGGGSAYVLKLDTNGKGLWAIQSSGEGSDENGYDVAIDPKTGDVLLAGSYNGRALFYNKGADGGPNGVVTTTKATGGEEKAFVAKYSQADKQWKWARGWIGPGNDGGVTRGVAIGPDGTVSVVGQIKGSIDIDGTTLPSADGTFVVKLAGDDGHTLWVTQIDGGGRADNGKVAIPHAATVDDAGNLIVTGEFNGSAQVQSAQTVGLDAGVAADAGAGATGMLAIANDMYLVKFGPDGRPVWAKQAGVANAITRGDDVALDPSGTIYVAGFKQGPTVFDTSSAPDTGNLFVARFDTGGNFKAVTVNTNDAHSGGEGLAIWAGAPGRGVFVGGTFDSETMLSSVKLTSAGQDDGLVGRLCW